MEIADAVGSAIGWKFLGVMISNGWGVVLTKDDGGKQFYGVARNGNGGGDIVVEARGVSPEATVFRLVMLAANTDGALPDEVAEQFLGMASRAEISHENVDKFRHLVCDNCWFDRNDNVPIRFHGEDAPGETTSCCACGSNDVDGIWVYSPDYVMKRCKCDKSKRDS